MKRSVALIVAITAMILLVVGIAYAVTRVCDAPTRKGTVKRDNLTGTLINNTIYGYQKGYTITDIVGPDRGVIYAGRGSDVIDVKEGSANPKDADYARCSDGYDTVYYDAAVDTVIGCELKNPVSP